MKNIFKTQFRGLAGAVLVLLFITLAPKAGATTYNVTTTTTMSAVLGSNAPNNADIFNVSGANITFTVDFGAGTVGTTPICAAINLNGTTAANHSILTFSGTGSLTVTTLTLSQSLGKGYLTMTPTTTLIVGSFITGTGGTPTYNISAGIIKTTGTFTMPTAAKTFATLEIVSGTCTLGIKLTVNGALTIDAPGTLNGSTFAIVDSGNIVVNGILSGSGTISAFGNILVNGTFSNTGTVTMSGTSTTISGSTSPVTFASLTISVGSTVTTSTNISASGNLIVKGLLNPGAAYTVGGGTIKGASGGTIIVTKTGTGSDILTAQYTGTVSLTTLSVKYAGGGAQGMGAGTYKSIEVANTGGINLLGAIILTGTLTMTNANLVLGSNNLTLNSGATVSGGSSSSYIQVNGSGSIIVKNVTSYTVPVGDDYAPVIIANGGGANYTITLVNSSAPHTAGIIWTITASSLQTPTFTFQWPASSEDISFDRTQCYVGQRTSPGGAWASLGTATGAAGGVGGPYTQSGTATSMTGGTPYDFSIGDNVSPLPVQLITFSAKMQNKAVELSWATASEINNNYFTIERSADGIHFEDIMTKPGAGNSQTVINYTAFDEQPLPGISYYRLKQTDFNGASQTFNVVSVDNNVSMQDFNIISAYPALFSDHFTLNYTAPANGSVRVVVTNMSGATVQDMTLTANAGNNSLNIGNTIGWRNGIYIVQLYYNNWVDYIKVNKSF